MNNSSNVMKIQWHQEMKVLSNKGNGLQTKRFYIF
jgi:hypothetical protein